MNDKIFLRSQKPTDGRDGNNGQINLS